MALGDEDFMVSPKPPSTTLTGQGSSSIAGHSVIAPTTGMYHYTSQWATATPTYGSFKSAREAELERKVAQLEGWVERLLGILEGRGLAPVE